MLISIESRSLFNLSSYDVINPYKRTINERLMIEFFILYYVANMLTHTLDVFIENGQVVHTQLRNTSMCDEIMLQDEELTILGVNVSRTNILCRDRKLGIAGVTFDIDVLKGQYTLRSVTTLNRGAWYKINDGNRDVQLTVDIISGTQSPLACITPSLEIRSIDKNTYKVYVPYEYYNARDPYSNMRIRIVCSIDNDVGIIDANLMFTRDLVIRCEDKYITQTD